MSFTENLIYLTLREEKLTIGDEKHLKQYELIENTLAKENINNKNLMVPWKFMVTSIFFLKMGMYILALPILFNLHHSFSKIIDNMIDFIVSVNLDIVYFVIILSILINGLLVLLINKKIANKINQLKNTPYNVESHLIELDSDLNIYKETEIYKIMLKNKGNMFGLLILLFLLKAIYFDVVKHLDWYFYPAWKIIWQII